MDDIKNQEHWEESSSNPVCNISSNLRKKINHNADWVFIKEEIFWVHEYSQISHLHSSK